MTGGYPAGLCPVGYFRVCDVGLEKRFVQFFRRLTTKSYAKRQNLVLVYPGQALNNEIVCFMAKLFRLVRVRKCEEKKLYFQERSARIYALFHAGF